MRRNVSIFALTLVVAAGLVIIGCNSGQQPTNDSATVAAIQSQLYQNAELKQLDVHVNSDHGVVTLTGQVQSTLEKLAIEALAQKAPGVKHVVDQLAVSTDATAQAPSSVASAKSPLRQEASGHKPRRHRMHQQAQDDSDMAMNGQTQPAQDQAATPGSSYAGSNSNPPAQPAAAPSPAGAAAPPPPQPVTITIPSGTVVSIRMIDSITSQTAQAGQEFAAVVFAPVAVGNQVVVPQGADAKVRLVQVHSAGHYQGQSELKVELTSLAFNGSSYNVESGYYDKTGNSRGKNSAEKIGGGAGLGALIGGLIGHGAGAAIGAGVGAAGGTVAQAASHGQQVTIPSEVKIDFVLKTPLTVTQSPGPGATGGNSSGQ
ncbi:MAG TPA: BON domain-containing protein [Terriglobia bacterium]|nr:BON domain-containing protein [Terriglobia bacterium]